MLLGSGTGVTVIASVVPVAARNKGNKPAAPEPSAGKMYERPKLAGAEGMGS
jgi:hypothetical protein